MSLTTDGLDALLNTSPGTWLMLADAVVKATIILAAAAASTLILQRASASLRHFVWTLALMAAIVAPALSTVLPRWQVPVVTLTSPAPIAIAASTDATAVPTPPLPRRTERARAVPAHTNSETTPVVVAAAPSARSDVSWSAVVLGLWALGVIVIVGRLALGILAVLWMSRRTERISEAPWLPLARELEEELGLVRRVKFLRSTRATMPMAWGVLTPAVLMPADADSWPLDRLRIVLLHELAHVKRRT
jgi:beta-lactamase regulating signal transducer with metallopeptidase domain